MTNILSDTARAAEHADALTRVYQGANRILTGERLTCVATHGGKHSPAAWTDGTEITFNLDAIGDLDFSDIVKYHGINFHELSHVLYTPRKGTQLVKAIIDAHLYRSFNILEDQRIETLFTTKYRSSVPWLTAAVLKWVLRDGAGQTGYLFVRGRRYLPGVLRGALRKSFVRPDLLPEVDRIVDAYRTLVFPTDYDVALDLVRAFSDILDQTGASITPDPHHSCSEDEGDLADKGRPAPVSDQRETRDKITEGEPEVEPQYAPSDSDDDSDDDNGSASEDQSESSDLDDSEADEAAGDDSADRSNSSNAEPGDTDDDGDWDEDFDDWEDEFGDGAGNGSGSDQPRDLKDLVGDLIDDIEQSKEVKDEVRRTQRLLSGADAADIIPKAKYNPWPVDADFSHRLGGLSKSLDRLLRAAEPGWHKAETNGRINALRWTRDRDLATAFDRWDEGVHDAVDMEVVILLDESGSMSGVFEKAVNAMWVLKRALDNIGASTTVITFENDSRTLYHRNERADKTTLRYSFKAGGTNPVMGLSQAKRIFARSRRTQQICILLTDGDFYGGRDEDDLNSDELLTLLRRSGVITALGFIEERPYWYSDTEWIEYKANPDNAPNGHGCEHVKALTVDTLVPFVSDIVKSVISARIKRR